MAPILNAKPASAALGAFVHFVSLGSVCFGMSAATVCSSGAHDYQDQFIREDGTIADNGANLRLSTTDRGSLRLVRSFHSNQTSGTGQYTYLPLDFAWKVIPDGSQSTHSIAAQVSEPLWFHELARADSIRVLDFDQTTGVGRASIDVPIGVRGAGLTRDTLPLLTPGRMRVEIVIGWEGELSVVDSGKTPLHVLNTSNVHLTVAEADIELHLNSGTGFIPDGEVIEGGIILSTSSRISAATQIALSVSPPGIIELGRDSLYVQPGALTLVRVTGIQSGLCVVEAAYSGQDGSPHSIHMTVSVDRRAAWRELSLAASGNGGSIPDPPSMGLFGSHCVEARTLLVASGGTYAEPQGYCAIDCSPPPSCRGDGLPDPGAVFVEGYCSGWSLSNCYLRSDILLPVLPMRFFERRCSLAGCKMQRASGGNVMQWTKKPVCVYRHDETADSTFVPITDCYQ